MNRQVKFRGQKVDNNEWVFGQYLISGKNHHLPNLHVIYSDNENLQKYMGLDSYTVKPKTIGQFTGLKDKNGRDIYEGDIVKLVINQNSQNYIGNHVKNLEYKTVVEYHHYASFVFKNLSAKRPNSYGFHSMNYGHSRMHTDLIEVVGNIHDDGV